MVPTIREFAHRASGRSLELSELFDDLRREHRRASRHISQLPRSRKADRDDWSRYQSDISCTLVFFREGTQPGGMMGENFLALRPLAEALVEKGQLEARLLKEFEGVEPYASLLEQRRWRRA